MCVFRRYLYACGCGFYVGELHYWPYFHTAANTDGRDWVGKELRRDPLTDIWRPICTQTADCLPGERLDRYSFKRSDERCDRCTPQSGGELINGQSSVPRPAYSGSNEPSRTGSMFSISQVQAPLNQALGFQPSESQPLELEPWEFLASEFQPMEFQPLEFQSLEVQPPANQPSAGQPTGEASGVPPSTDQPSTGPEPTSEEPTSADVDASTNNDPIWFIDPEGGKNINWDEVVYSLRSWSN